mgnify:CR=1 FL=1
MTIPNFLILKYLYKINVTVISEIIKHIYKRVGDGGSRREEEGGRSRGS